MQYFMNFKNIIFDMLWSIIKKYDDKKHMLHNIKAQMFSILNVVHLKTQK